MDCDGGEAPFFLLSEISVAYEAPSVLGGVLDAYSLRGPPQA